MKNKVFEVRIKYWENKNPIWEKVFDKQGESYKLIEFIDKIIAFAETVPEVIPLSLYELVSFIDGLAVLPLVKNGDEDSEEALKVKKLTDPTLNYLRKLFSTNSWREFIIKKELSGDEILKIESMEIPISIEQMKLHIERLNTYPLTREHVAVIEVDLIDYKKKQYAPPKLVEIIETSLLEAIYKEFQGEVFNATQSDFIKAINVPEKYGDLIKPRKRKTTYLYYILGEISHNIINNTEWNHQICLALGFNIDTYYKKKSGSELPIDFTKRVNSILLKDPQLMIPTNYSRK